MYVSILFDPMKNKTNYYSGTFIQETPLGKEPNVPEWRLNLGFGNLKKCPFPLNRNVPSMEATDTKITLNVNKFPGPNFVSPEWGFSKGGGFTVSINLS